MDPKEIEFIRSKWYQASALEIELLVNFPWFLRKAPLHDPRNVQVALLMFDVVVEPNYNHLILFRKPLFET